ncbi:class I SAM-dependent methyltransferase [Pelomicrobium sp.]|jgi:ubiquinone/menaquinone biosynthesis C-methylase UbiE|uniref:class I SAM-dependent methyltransferase n=1 Tax=unclassified Pelomicrobium TaxID=2815318 RepID=UPI0021DE13AB|nr:MAG: methyltransferase [Burkholderiales bacterium]
MSFYDKWILPRLTDLAMRNKEATRYRAQLLPQARGVTLEVGVGSGLNLPFYGPQVDRLYAVDPSEELLRMAEKKVRGAPFPVELLARSAEEIPIDDRSIDTVVTTWSLCSIPNPLKALAEMRRVLKPGGVLLFAEHGLAPEASVQRWQRRLNPLWNKLAGGCNLDRKMDELVRGAGFRILELATEYAKGPRPMSYIYFGRAAPG